MKTKFIQSPCIKDLEVAVYKIEATVPSFIPFFKKTIRFLLTYNIPENRFWYYEISNNKVLEGHITKNGFEDSEAIMDGIYTRLSLFLSKKQLSRYKLKDIDKIWYMQILNVSRRK
jgi:hypothetical protein